MNNSDQTEETPANFNFRMTDLEEQLTGENATIVRGDALRTLSQGGDRLRANMDAGLPKDVYQKTEIAYRALAAAHQITANFPIEPSNR